MKSVNNNSSSGYLLRDVKEVEKGCEVRKILRYTISFVVLSAAPVSYAVDFEFADGEIVGTVDTTVSYGATFRTESRDSAQAAIGLPAELERRSQVNENDGNKNFDTGLVSSTVKITSELDVSRENYGVFVRGTAFYDEVIMHGNHDGGLSSADYENNGYGNDFGDSVKDEVGSRAEILDAYIWADWMVANRPLNVRFGEQVVSWGEALFLQEGINQINPASLATLRLPGAEVKEALIPLPMLFVQYGLTDNLTLESYYQFKWENSEADPVGTFLSSDDALAAEGGNSVVVTLPSSIDDFSEVYNFYERGVVGDPILEHQVSATRAPTYEPKDDGQYGVALRYFAESLNDTEFGLYYVNFHSHKPTAGAILGSAFGTSIDGSAACAAAQQTLASIGVSAGCGDMNGILAQGSDPSSIVAVYNWIHLIDNSQYFRVYEEDVKLLGLSFNTSIGNTSLAGELSYRKDSPFLPEDGDNLIGYLVLNTFDIANQNIPEDLGPFVEQLNAEETRIVTENKDMFNLSLVAIHSFGPMLGASQFIGVLETGLAYVGGLDDDLLYTAEGVDLFLLPENISNPNLTDEEIAAIPWDGDANDFLDATSWGYRLVTKLDYNNVFAGINLSPVFRFAHDVRGNSIRGGNFMENRKSVTLALNGSYLFNFQFSLSYTGFWGADLRNYLSDRDHASVSVKYSF